MFKKIILIIITILIYILCCYKINLYFNKHNTNNTKNEKNINSIIKEIIPKKETPIGYLIIDKINLNEELYDINSELNNIEKHVTILKESTLPFEKNSTIFLAAHSGTGKIAYFNELDKLSLNEKIILKYKNNTYTYIIKNIWETKKNGTINVPKENKNQLVLTTCSPTKDEYQLIINSTIL